MSIALGAGACLASTAPAAVPSVAFFYAADPPWDELAAFDRVVVEPTHTPRPPELPGGATEVFAYVALGEMQPGRPYAADFPPEWRRGENTTWGSWRIDQAQPQWPRFFVQRIVRPLWEAGYRAFFVDVLDAYHAFSGTAEERSAQEAGMVRAIRALKSEYPGARLMVNRGFEILPEIHRDVIAVAAESLYRGWNPADNSYREVSTADRDFLLNALGRARAEFGLDIIAIDYVAPGDRALARATAARIAEHGFAPWVAEHTLSQLGVGSIEVMPRKVLALHDSGRDRIDLAAQPIARYAALPLHYLGFVPEYRDFTVRGFPEGPLAGRYQAIVTWLNQETPEYEQTLAPFLARAVREGVRVIALGGFGLAPGPALDAMLPVTSRARPENPAEVRIAARAPGIGFEAEPLADRRGFHALAAQDARPLLRLEDAHGAKMEAVAITPWGGYALAPYHLLALPGGNGARWVIDPIEFFFQALGRPAFPVPDVTTAVGARALVVQADATGTSLPSDTPLPEIKATVPGAERVARARSSPALRAADVLAAEILSNYRIPITFVGGRVGPGLGHVIAADSAPLPLPPGTITRAEPSLTMVAAPTQPRDAGDMTLFPGADDATLTRDWTGASFGYERAIESFELTERPYRVTPLGIAFQTRSAARRASLGALHRVFRHALAGEPHPMTTAEYSERVADFRHTVIARTARGWLVRGPAPARTLRLPEPAMFDLAASDGVAGFAGRYIHIVGHSARLREGAVTAPYIVRSNGAVTSVERTRAVTRFELTGHVPLRFELANGADCTVSSARGSATPIERGERTRYELFSSFQPNADGDRRATILCRG